jgi:glycosyltransferase involved in cell wall biosynthesis
LLAEADFDVPVVAVQHSCVASWWEAVRGTALPEDFRWRTELVRRGLRRADVVAAPSASFAATTARLYDLGERVRTVHNGRTQRQRAPAAPDDCVFTAGRLWDEGKDLATLDAAASRLAVPVCAAGPVQAPHGAGIAFEAVHALGLLDEEAMAARLARRPIFVSSALYEPFGLAVLEAAAAGCPLILSDIPAFRELWDGAALFVAPRDADGFAATIEALLGDDLRRDALGRRARSKARRFTAAAMAAGMAALYGSLGVTESATARLPLAGAAA